MHGNNVVLSNEMVMFEQDMINVYDMTDLDNTNEEMSTTSAVVDEDHAIV